MTAVIDYDPTGAETLHNAVSGDCTLLPTFEALRDHLDTHTGEDCVVVGASVDLESALSLATEMRVIRPSLGVVLVRRRVDTSLLGDALRAGVREVIEERNLAGVNTAVQRVQNVAHAIREQVPGASEEAEPEARGTVVTVFSAKGGCGKTTLSTNLAAALADGGRREVCLVDLDLSFGDVAIALQLYPSHTIADAVKHGEALDLAALEAILTPHSAGLTTLVAPVEPGASGISADLVGRILDLLRPRFDFVIVDTPPAFDDPVLAAFDRSDVIALIATLDIPALKNLKLTLETLDLLNYSRDKWLVVLNRADSKVGLALNEVEKTLRVPIAVQIPSSRDVPASINRGVPIVVEDPRHPVSQAIKAFAEAKIVTKRARATNAVPAGLRSDRRGFLRRRAKTP